MLICIVVVSYIKLVSGLKLFFINLFIVAHVFSIHVVFQLLKYVLELLKQSVFLAIYY